MKQFAFTLFLILTLVLISHTDNFAQETSPSAKEDRSFGSLHKSLLFPGWGQLSEKKYFKGFVFLGAEIFCFASILHNNNRGNKAYQSYKDALNMEDVVHYRKLTEKYDTIRNQYFVAAAAVWALNLIDIYFIVKKKQTKERNLTFRLDSVSQKNLSLTISYRF